MGVPHTDGGWQAVLHQEFFATWFSLMCLHELGHVRDGSVLTTTPIPAAQSHDQLAYDVGKHAAVAAVGSTANAEHLAVWRASAHHDPAMDDDALALQRAAEWGASVDDVAAAVVESWNAS